MKIRYFVATLLVASLCSCASRPDDIEASYVSSTLYENLSCQQLEAEAQSVSQRAMKAAGVQTKKANNDTAAMAVGIIVFWPALFLTKGDGASAAEVSRLKGEMVAIEEASIKKDCGIKFDKAEPKKK